VLSLRSGERGCYVGGGQLLDCGGKLCGRFREDEADGEAAAG